MNGHVYLIENGKERREMNVMTSMTPYIHVDGEVLMTYELLRLLNNDIKKEIEYLVIGEGCGNDLRMDLKICDYPNLKVLSIHNNSLNNIHSLTISNNPLLREISFGETNEENNGCMENVESIEISSIF